MRILITGGDGFIGATLGTALRQRGHIVRSMDLRASGPARGDVTSAADCHKFCRDIDVVMHGAAIHHAVKTREQPDEVIRVNVGGTENLLSAAQAAGVRRFVYLSTGKTYGEPSRIPSRENDKLAPLDTYARSKLEAEQLCLAAHRACGVDLAILRPFSVYGVGQDLDTGYIGMLLAALREGLEPELPGSPDFMRDFVYIDDVVELACRCIEQPLDGPTIVNAASGRAYTLGALIRELGAVAGRPISVRYRQPSSDTVVRTCGDVSEGARLFGFLPRFSLEEGLRRSLDWALGARAVQASNTL